MFDELLKLFQIDWRIFMAGAEAWLNGRNPYGALSSEFSAGAFAYPPTALTWLALFVPLGPLGYYVWTGLELLLWWLLIRNGRRSQLLLLCWSPMILHLVEGQSSLAVVLVMWAATRAERRGWLWGLAIAWSLTKPQVAIVPLLWLLWQDRASPLRWRLWGGIALGTALLALPPTLLSPGIWGQWIASLGSYRGRILQMAAWQGPSVVILALAGYLWYRSRRGGWQWWLAAGMFPQTSFYAIVALLPALRPRQSNWTLAGLGLAGILQPATIGPAGNEIILLHWLLAGHMLAAWMVAGGPKRDPVPAALPSAPVKETV
jgi:Glycosyltransferase family 87